MAILKPFLMLASVAFVAGFAGYLAMARIGAAPTAADYQQTQTLPAEASDDWNIGKRI